MTAPLPPNADELVSAYLDGDAAPEEVATIEASPELMARVEAMRLVTEGLAAPVTPPPPELRQAHLSAALDTFDEMVAAHELGASTPGLSVVPGSDTAAAVAAEPPGLRGPTAETEPKVTSLAAARARHRPRRLSLVAAAAAAVALLFAGIVAFGLNRGTSRDVVDAPSTAIEAGSRGADGDDSAADDAGSFDAAAETDSADAEPSLESAADAPEAAALAPQAGEALEGDATLADEEARAIPLPTLAPPAAGAAADDDTTAGEDTAAGDAEGDFAVEAEADDEAATELLEEPGEDARFELGDHVDLEALDAALDIRFAGVDLADEVAQLAPVAPPTACADVLFVLVGSEEPTLLGLATIEARIVEVHVVDDDTVVVARDDCSVLGDLTP